MVGVGGVALGGVVGAPSMILNPTQPHSAPPPMPPTPKPEGRRRQRDPQCRSAQEEAEPLNDPKQAHLVAAGSGRVGPSRVG